MVPFGSFFAFQQTVVEPCESCTCDISLSQLHVSEFMYVLFPRLSICSLFITSQVELVGFKNFYSP